MKLRRRSGITFTTEGHRNIVCVVTGEMSDGRKVWTECDRNGRSHVRGKNQFRSRRSGDTGRD